MDSTHKNRLMATLQASEPYQHLKESYLLEFLPDLPTHLSPTERERAALEQGYRLQAFRDLFDYIEGKAKAYHKSRET